MPRARNIKHSFFTNDDLADLEPIERLAFIGLWTLADYRGNLEYKAKKIKAMILPYDNCDMDKIAINLDKSGFIRMYSDGEVIYLNIPNFIKHQNPHKNEKEKGTDIPDFSENMRQLVDLKGLTINRDKSRLNQEYSASTRADSLFLKPDSLFLIFDYVFHTFVYATNCRIKEKQVIIPYQQIADYYNTLFAIPTDNPQVVKVTDKRKRAIKKFWNFDTTSDKQEKLTNNLDYFKRYFEYCASVEFFNPTKERVGEYANWKPDFDFIVREETLIKIKEGKYK